MKTTIELNAEAYKQLKARAAQNEVSTGHMVAILLEWYTKNPYEDINGEYDPNSEEGKRYDKAYEKAEEHIMRKIGMR